MPLVVRVRQHPSVDFRILQLPQYHTRIIGGHPSWAPLEYLVDCRTQEEAELLVYRLNTINGVFAEQVHGESGQEVGTGSDPKL
jgi:hypothetical protein